MTTPPPYDGRFTTPPLPPAHGFTVDADGLPEIPPPPRSIMAGLGCMALAGVFVLFGAVGRVAYVFAGYANIDLTGPHFLVGLIVVPVAAVVVLALVGYNIWRGYSTPLYFMLVACAGAILKLLSSAIEAVPHLVGRQALPGFGSGLAAIGTMVALLAGACAVPAFVAFVMPGSLRWAQKANALRYMRKCVKLGKPVHPLPPHLRR